MIKLWGRPNSLCTQRVLWCMAEAGIEYEMILASAIYGPQGHVWRGGKPFGIVDQPEYRRMNPNGTVPTIDDDGTYVWESNAIVSYLAMAYAPALHGGTARQFGRASSWMGWCNSSFNDPLAHATAHLLRLPPEQRRPEMLRLAEQQMAPVLTTIDTALAEHDFIAGDTLSIGDIALGPFVRRWYHFGLANPDVPRVEQWLARLGERPGFAVHVAPRDFHIDPE